MSGKCPVVKEPWGAGVQEMLAAVGGLQENCWQQQIGHLAQVSFGQGQKPGSKGETLMWLPGGANAGT